MPQSQSYTIALRLSGTDIEFIDKLHDTGFCHLAICSFRTWSGAQYRQICAKLEVVCQERCSFRLSTCTVDTVGKNPSLVFNSLSPNLEELHDLHDEIVNACRPSRNLNFRPHITLTKPLYYDPTDCHRFQSQIDGYFNASCRRGRERKLEFSCTGLELVQNKPGRSDLAREFSFSDVNDDEEDDHQDE
ncbi:hypothetical protein C8R45DRAFT_1088004 [Mycena sanguinolenta]|nr:hypothetical protein C8R45DRAFT_1088004 [Mycena sanguinolenta]